MANATVISVWTTNLNAFMAVSVVEAGGQRVEYIGSVARADLAGLTGPQKKALLVAAVKAVRDAQLDAITPDATITGSVTV